MDSGRGGLAAATALFFVPASPVPMAAQVGSVLGGHHQVAYSGRDGAFTTRTDIVLAGCVGLHRCDDF